MNKPYVIAEIGVNYYDIAVQHNITPLEAAKLMINEASKAGANAAKFQTYKAGKIASKNSPSYWDTSKEGTKNQFELFSKFDKFSEKEYTLLAEYCAEVEIDFMSTPFDLEAVDYIDNLVSIHKISSSDITNFPLLKKVAKTGKKILLSTGASNKEEIKDAIEILNSNGAEEIVLLHCILNYPTLNKDANLGMILDLKSFNLEVGYSDHTLPDTNMVILSTAVMLGASYIEKHFTLDKSLPGNDHYHAMDPNDLKTFTSNLKIINECFGSSVKTFLPSENISRTNARRSVYVSKKLKKGDVLKTEDIICKRPAAGIPASQSEQLIGKELLVDIEDDTVLTWNILK